MNYSDVMLLITALYTVSVGVGEVTELGVREGVSRIAKKRH